MLSSDPHQRLSRHEALLDLLTHMLRQTSVEAIAAVVAERWKYCATIHCWRLILADQGDRFLVIDAALAQVKISYLARAELDPADTVRLDRQIPERLSRGQIDAATPPLAAHLRAASIQQVVVLHFGERQSLGRAMLYAGVSQGDFDKLDLKFITAVGAHFAYHIDACRQQERIIDALTVISFRDGLTQIPNRKKLDEQLPIEWRRAMRNGTSLSFLMIDVDHFKQFNDRFGHMAGDDCLKKVAAAIAGQARRASDLPARYGGEEFAVLLPETTSAGAMVVAARVNEAVRALSIPHFIAGRETFVTISVGCASATPSAPGFGAPSTEDALLKAADAALYAAKRQGRDRCVEWTTTTEAMINGAAPMNALAL